MIEPASRSRPDTVTREIIVGKSLATVDEMAIVLARASMSPVVYEVLDFACGICDAAGRADCADQRHHHFHRHVLDAGALHSRPLRRCDGAGRHVPDQ